MAEHGKHANARIGWRDVFVTPGASPFLKYVRCRSKFDLPAAVVLLATLLSFGWLYSQGDVFSPYSNHNFAEEYFVFMFLGFSATELIAFGYGFFAQSLLRARKGNRFSELSVTLLDPLDILEYIIAKRMWWMQITVAATAACLSILHLVFFWSHGACALGHIVLGINLIVSLCMTQWLQIEYFLLHPVKSAVARHFTSLFIAFDMVFAFAICMAIFVWIVDKKEHFFPAMLAVFLLMLPVWWAKYRVACESIGRIGRALGCGLDK